MPHTFWKSFADRIRTKHPGFFMFGESFAYDAAAIAEHTYDENGGITVLDFPGQAAMNAVFAQGEPYTRLLDYLHLESQVYANPYDLMTFYDNHDMPRMAADAQGFIDAHNWIFTSRGIPVVYYGSESGFRAGAKEHAGNRDYFGPDNLALARQHPIRDALVRVAGIRRHSVALQRGLQLNLAFDQDTAVFLRVYQHAGVSQSALVLLNRGNEPATLSVGEMLNRGQWHDAVTDVVVEVHDAGPDLVLTVAPHGLRVLLFNGPVNNPELASSLERLQSLRLRPQ
jgi:cyclomaltodextrin glucanotransferase